MHRHGEGDASLHPKSEELGLQTPCAHVELPAMASKGPGLWECTTGPGSLEQGLSPSSVGQHACVPHFQEAWNCLLDGLSGTHLKAQAGCPSPRIFLGRSLPKGAIRLCIREKQKRLRFSANLDA